jgi:hypothetical protein
VACWCGRGAGSLVRNVLISRVVLALTVEFVSLQHAWSKMVLERELFA